jgi:ketosteroid isomerase-like protein
LAFLLVIKSAYPNILKMKRLVYFLCIIFFASQVNAQEIKDSAQLRKSLDKATDAIREAFAKKDIELVIRLHSPQIIKYFGGNNVIVGREGLRNQITGWFKSAKEIKFIENTVESTVFTGNTAIQTVIFAIRTMPGDGGQPTIARGRAMVVFVQDKDSPTGWLSLREISQEAPAP